jgi:hypothetical protein
MAISDRQDDGHKASVEQKRSRGNLTCPSSGRRDARQNPSDGLDAEPPAPVGTPRVQWPQSGIVTISEGGP